MPKLYNTPDTTKLLIEVYVKTIEEPNNSFAYGYKLAIETGFPEMDIIESLQKDLSQSESICTMIDILGVELAEKISNF